MANISATEIEDMDLISQLPEPIVHHILCFCSPLELVRTSVLSKKWFRLTASFPFLYFNLSDFEHVSKEVTAFTLRLVTHVFDKRFLKYVDYTTTRFCQHSLTADMLTIITKLYEPAELDIVNRCLELLLQKGVRKLEINITNYSSESPYRLPDVLLSVSVLDSLTIHGCDLPSSFMLDAIKFTSLSKLRLQNVHIDDEAIKYLTTSCPLLQLFEVTACHGFKRFCVHRHQNLQDVWIHYNTPVERIDIDAPNLSTLYITDIDGSGPPQMNLASCEKLTTVIYDARSLSNSNGFTNFLSNFPFVEYLVWAAPHCNNLKLSSHSLRTLELSSQCDLEEIEFNTPNLVSFSYTCSFSGLKSLLRDSIHLKGFMHCYPYNIDTRWIQKLRQFLNKENGFKVFNLYIHATYSQKFTRLE